MGYWNWGYFEKKPARAVKGGIKAQSKRGAFGESWWAKRWIATLESFDIASRLNRGRSYARSGQVMSIDITKATVKAQVQGSSPTPYAITIKITALTDADWKKLARALSSEAIYTAKLLAGEMPPEIETTFTEAGLSLFPAKLRDLETNCSCPDWSNPCKHIAAVYYLLAEEFDRDPFLIFKLRGIEREELFKLLEADDASTRKSAQRKTKSHLAPPPEPLTTNADGFWRGGELPADLFGEVFLPPTPAALPRRLGNFPFWRGANRFLEAIEPLYTNAAPRGLDVFAGQVSAGDESK